MVGYQKDLTRINLGNMSKNLSSNHFNHLKRNDREVYNILVRELNREHNTLELIASENFASYATLEMTGSVLTN